MTATAIEPLKHYWHTLENGFWFKNAYERLFVELPDKKPSTWVEIGSFYGGSMAWLGVETVNSGKPVTLHTVDNFSQAPEADFRRNMEPISERLGKRFHVHVADSYVAATKFKPASVDVVWVDADHSYSGVLTDLTHYWPLVKPGGYIGGDDYMPDYAGVEKAVTEFFSALSIPVGIGDGSMGSHLWHWWLVRKPA